MSNRSWKRTRRQLRGYKREIDADKRARRRIPWHIRLMSFFIEPRIRKRWLDKWEAEHRRKLKRAMKTGSRLMRRIEG